ncbi:MAG: hypothetical protein K2N22_03835 [Clostridia bacterium]|nr:hypothetical protein [Clostridia bacterium]
MEEIDNVVEVVEQPSGGQKQPSKAGAAIKEWFRKFTVKLKHRPMNIAFFVMIVSTIVYLCSLGNYSQSALKYTLVDWLGLSIFVNTLFCILSLLLFMNSFPKRSKKPKVVMLVLFFLFVAAMITFDVLFYIRAGNAYHANLVLPDVDTTAEEKFIIPALNATIAHIVLVGLGAILTATYPLYGKLLNMINTKKVIESTELKEAIDTEDED